MPAWWADHRAKWADLPMIQVFMPSPDPADDLHDIAALAKRNAELLRAPGMSVADALVATLSLMGMDALTGDLDTKLAELRDDNQWQLLPTASAPVAEAVSA